MGEAKPGARAEGSAVSSQKYKKTIYQKSIDSKTIEMYNTDEVMIMKGRDIVKAIMAENKVSNAQLAHKMGLPIPTTWARLNGKTVKDIPLSAFNEMLIALGYKVVVVAEDKPVEAGEYVVTSTTTAEAAEAAGEPVADETDAKAGLPSIEELVEAGAISVTQAVAMGWKPSKGFLDKLSG